MGGLKTRFLILVISVIAVASAAVRADHTSAPQNLQSQVNGDSVVLTWRAGGLNPPEAWIIEAGSAPGLTDLSVVSLPWDRSRGLNAEFSVRGVAAGTYYVRVRAEYDSVASAPSAEITLNVGQSGCQLPTAPRNVSASTQSSMVTLDWDPPMPGATANGYRIEVGSTAGATDLAVMQVGADPTFMTARAASRRYYVRLRSLGACGTSEPSPEVVITVP